MRDVGDIRYALTLLGSVTPPRHPERKGVKSKDLLRFGKESRTRSFGTRLAARLRMTLWVGFGDDRGWWVALGGDGAGPSASRTFLNILTRFSVNWLHYRTFLQLFDSMQRTVLCPFDFNLGFDASFPRISARVHKTSQSLFLHYSRSFRTQPGVP